SRSSAARWLGRSQRARSRPSGPSSESWAPPRPRPGALGLPPLRSGCANSAGSRAELSRSRFAGPMGAPNALPRSRPSSFDSRSMSFSRRELRSLRQNRPPRSSRSCSRWRGTGVVTSLARPGGNVTGLSAQSTELVGKRLELLREIIPSLRQLAVMYNASNPNVALEAREVQAAARTLDLQVATLEIRRAEGSAGVFEKLRDRAEALYIAADPLVIANRIRINTLALAARLPTMFAQREHVDAGGLIAYGADSADQFRRAGDLVDKILRGAKAGDLPIEQPIKFNLIINLTTAKTLGLDMPAKILALADEVLE